MDLRKIFHEKMTVPEYYNTYIGGEDLKGLRKICCPLHMESTPSFFYFPHTDTFSCFGCGRGGAIIELHYHYTQIHEDPDYTRSQAIDDLARMLGINLKGRFIDFDDLLGGPVPQKYYEQKIERQLRGNPIELAKADVLRAFGNTPLEICTAIGLVKPPIIER